MKLHIHVCTGTRYSINSFIQCWLQLWLPLFPVFQPKLWKIQRSTLEPTFDNIPSQGAHTHTHHHSQRRAFYITATPQVAPFLPASNSNQTGPNPPSNVPCCHSPSPPQCPAAPPIAMPLVHWIYYGWPQLHSPLDPSTLGRYHLWPNPRAGSTLRTSPRVVCTWPIRWWKLSGLPAGRVLAEWYWFEGQQWSYVLVHEFLRQSISAMNNSNPEAII